jgi:ribose/xylose/arabinose/galactoside ABC-type transport system permease subunit
MTALQTPAPRPIERVKSALHTFRNRHASWIPVFAALAILLGMLGFGEWYFGNFFTPRLLSTLLLDNAYLLVLAVGMTFVILTGGIDLSVGSVMAFTGILSAKLLNEGVSAGVAIPIMIVAGALIGLLMGVLVHYFDVQPFIATLVGMLLARGLAFLVSTKSI